MKKNQIIIATFAIILINCVSIFGQSFIKASSYVKNPQLTEIEKAVTLYWKGQTPEAKQAVKLLENIYQKTPDNWVAPYWASYISTQIINSEKDNPVYLKKAERLLNEASGIFEKNPDTQVSPYFHALRSLILRFKGSEFIKLKDWKSFGAVQAESVKELNKGIAASPNNPVLMVMAATGIGRNRQKDFRQTIAAVALLEKAKVEFGKIKDRSPADITYWNEHWINFWLNSLKKLN